MSSNNKKVQNPYSSPTNIRHNSSTKRVATEAAAFSPGTNIVAPVHKSLPAMHSSNKKKKAVPSTISVSSSASSTRSSCTRTVTSSTSASTATATFQSPPAFHVDGPTGGSSIATSHARSRDESNEESHWDPRGVEDRGGFLGSHFCVECMCTKTKCHNIVFGKYCQLHIVHEVYHGDIPLSLEQAEEILTSVYNDALQFKIFENTGTLDVKPSGYFVPDCVRTGSLEQSLNYIRYRTYHNRMHRNITVGRYGFPETHTDLNGDKV